MPNSLIVTEGMLYLNGLNLSRTDDEVIAITIGSARNSSNVNDIGVGVALAVSNLISGAGGLDTGAVAANTHYAVYVIGDSTHYNLSAGLLSLVADDPLLPLGYDMYRRVGWVKTDATSDFLEFRQQGASTDRWMWWDLAIPTDITAGSAAAFAAVDVSGGVPDLTASGELNMLTVFTPTAPNDTCELRPGSSSAAVGYAVASGAVAAVVESTNLVCPYDITTGVDYIVTGSAVALSVVAYMDKLG